MARSSLIDKRIAELESEIQVREHAIAVLKSVKSKPAKVRKLRDAKGPAGSESA